jgi:thiol:disulfide interchange protein DsbD
MNRTTAVFSFILALCLIAPFHCVHGQSSGSPFTSSSPFSSRLPESLSPGTTDVSTVKVSASVVKDVIEVRFDMSEELYLYKDTIKVTLISPQALATGTAVYPKGKIKKDPFTDKDRELFSSPVIVKIPLSGHVETPDTVSFDMTVSYQACSDDACLMPANEKVAFSGILSSAFASPEKSSATEPQTLPLNTGSMFNISEAPLPQPDKEEKEVPSDNTTVVRETVSSSPVNTGESNSSAQGDPAKDLIDSWGIIGYYLAGVLLSFTPCIFPMIPVTMSVIGSKEGTPLQGFFRSLIYVFGLALTYAILGLMAAVSGGVIGAAMQNPYVVFCVSALFFLMGMSMMDLFHFQLPSFLQPSGSSSRGKGYVSVFLTGLAAGLVASPCVAPVIVGVLLQIASEGNLVMGFFKLFALGWGLGTILIIVGTFSSAIAAFPKAGMWMNEVKKGLGLMLMGAAFYYLQGALSQAWFTTVFGLFLIIAGIASGATDSIAPEATLYPRLVKAMGIVFLITGIYLFGGQMIISGFIHPPFELPQATVTSAAAPTAEQWQKATKEKVAQAAKEGKPVVLDFGAKWCAACVELEEKTFPVKEVIEKLNSFVSLKVDMTQPGPKEEAFQKQYNVIGFPTLIFINSKGEVIEELTTIGFVDAPAFIEKLSQVD